VIRYFLIFSIFFSHSVFASVKIQLLFPETEITQGQLHDVTLMLNEEAAQAIELQKLKGATLGESIYIFNVSPLMRKDGEKTFGAQGQIIFAKIPDKNEILHRLGDVDILVTWSEVKIQPTETNKQFIFEDFNIPGRVQIIRWLLIILIPTALLTVFWFLRKKWLIKKNIRLKKLSIKNKLILVDDYQGIVEMWMNKSEIFEIFPHAVEPFKQFEKVLFKYQFKHSQTELEKSEVVEAYKNFLDQIKEGFNGI
jgi:hypothetical protein